MTAQRSADVLRIDAGHAADYARRMLDRRSVPQIRLWLAQLTERDPVFGEQCRVALNREKALRDSAREVAA